MTEIRIELEADELFAAQQAAAATGVDMAIEPQPEAIEPVTAILIGGGALLVGRFVVDLLERLKGGVIVDMRPGAKALVKRSRELPVGFVLVIAQDGSVKIETRDAPKDASERLLEKIIDGTLNTAKDIAEAAAGELGADRVSPEAA